MFGKIGKNKPCPCTRKQKISTVNKGRIYIYKGDVVKTVKKMNYKIILNKVE